MFFPTVAVLGQLVAAKLIRPLNHSYIPNMANVWPDYRDPFYDQGWQYTTPYSIYTTGMAWRKDKVNLSPSWNMPWQGAPYAGKVAVLDDYRETISLALLRAGNLDLNTTNTAQIHAAGKALSQLSARSRTCGSTTTTTPTFRQERPGFTTPGRVTWPARASTYPRAPRSTRSATGSRPNRKGPVANDLMVNLTSGSNPVLSHLFINYMLEVNNALENYSFVGYMQPLTEVTPAKLTSEKLLPPQLASTVVLPDYFRNGLFQLELPPAADAVWESTWNSFSKGL